MKKLALALILAAFAWPVLADYEPVYLGGELVGAFRVGYKNLTAKDRADKVITQFNEVLSDPDHKSSEIKTRKLKSGAYEVYIRKISILTVTRDDAKAAKTMAEKLAKRWAKNLAWAYNETKPIKDIPKKDR